MCVHVHDDVCMMCMERRGEEVVGARGREGEGGGLGRLLTATTNSYH